MLAILFHNFDPVVFSVAGLPIRWYSLAYIAGMLLGYYLLNYLNKHLPQPILNAENKENIILWAVIGIVLGGRLGYVLFYHPSYYLEHPLEILKTWEGGMSFHGGILGIIVSLYVFSKRNGYAYLQLMDLIACVAPIGIFLGRLANFINAELVGRPTHMPWGMIFPHYDIIPRHPSQLYEAGGEGVLVFLIMLYCFFRIKLFVQPGRLSGMFLISYSIMRIIIENFREPDISVGYWFSMFTTGQLLCVPMLIIGAYLLKPAHITSPK